MLKQLQNLGYNLYQAAVGTSVEVPALKLSQYLSGLVGRGYGVSGKAEAGKFSTYMSDVLQALKREDNPYMDRVEDLARQINLGWDRFEKEGDMRPAPAPAKGPFIGPPTAPVEEEVVRKELSERLHRSVTDEEVQAEMRRRRAVVNMAR
jgi:hypothetical protein